MNTECRCFLALVVLMGAPAMSWAADAAANKKIVPKRARDELLDRGAAMLAPAPAGTVDRFAMLRSPFTKPVPVVQAAPTDGSAPEPEVVRLSNADVLKAVATQLKPRGTIIFGASRILRLERGQLKAGDELPATIAGEQYKVVVDRIEADSYTLRLGGEVLSLPTNPSLNAGATRDRPAAEATSPAPTP